MNHRTTVIAVAKVEGFHQWSDAPKVVGYLASKHRHIFTVRGEWTVTHNDRQVEFHIARRWLIELIGKRFKRSGQAPVNFGGRSCEHIALELRETFLELGLPLPSAIEVWEDDENGARVEFERV